MPAPTGTEAPGRPCHPSVYWLSHLWNLFFRESECVQNKNASIGRKCTTSEYFTEVDGSPKEHTTPRRVWKFRKEIYLLLKFPSWGACKHGGHEKEEGDGRREKEKGCGDAPKMGGLRLNPHPNQPTGNQHMCSSAAAYGAT